MRSSSSFAAVATDSRPPIVHPFSHAIAARALFSALPSLQLLASGEWRGRKQQEKKRQTKWLGGSGLTGEREGRPRFAFPAQPQPAQRATNDKHQHTHTQLVRNNDGRDDGTAARNTHPPRTHICTPLPPPPLVSSASAAARVASSLFFFSLFLALPPRLLLIVRDGR